MTRRGAANEPAPARTRAAAPPQSSAGDLVPAELRRLRALHADALAIAALVSTDRAAIVTLLTEIVDRAVVAVDGRDGLLILAEDPAWSGLCPDLPPSDGLLTLRSGGAIGRRPARPEGTTMQVLRTGRSLAVVDTLDDQRFGTYAEMTARGVLSFAIVPLRAGPRTLGALSLGFGRTGMLPDADREALELFGAHAAAALERVRLAEAEHRRAEDLARQGAEATALRELDRLKDQFIAMISHELRTPLSLVLGYAELLESQRGALDAETIEVMSGKIRLGAEQLTRLVDDLLDFARIERGEIKIHLEEFDLAPTLRELVAAIGREAEEQIVCQVPDQLPIRADRTRVSQIVGHLLGNALKYAPRGPVLLRARQLDLVVLVEVQDHGPGIPIEEQHRVWDKFFRGAGIAEKNVVRGAGIGLSIVKSMVEAQRGRVGLESHRGRGARFWFELPRPI